MNPTNPPTYIYLTRVVHGEVACPKCGTAYDIVENISADEASENWDYGFACYECGTHFVVTKETTVTHTIH